jgi:hypothetical protein
MAVLLVRNSRTERSETSQYLQILLSLNERKNWYSRTANRKQTMISLLSLAAL